MRSYVLRVLFLLIAFASVLAPAQAQAPTSVDVESRWSRAVIDLAQGIAGELDRDAFDKLFADNATMQAFDRDRVELANMVGDRMTARALVSARSYLHPSVSAASDLVADALKFGALPDAIARDVILDDPAQLRAADATVARWFSVALEAESGDPVAMLAFLDDGAADVAAGRSASTPKLYLVIVRGKVMPDGSVRVARLLYGDLRQAAN